MSKEVGAGHVAVMPTFKGFRSAANAEFTATARSGSSVFRSLFQKAGGDSGKGFASSFKQATAGVTATTLKQATQEVAKSSRELSTMRLREQDAVGKVRVAEAQLAEARRRYEGDSAQLVRAEERLASAQRAQLSVRQNVITATDRLARAQRTLRTATEETNSAGTRQGGVFRNLISNAGGYFRQAGQDAAGSFGSTFRTNVGQIFTGSFFANIASGVARAGVQGVQTVVAEGIRYGIESVDLASSLEQSAGAVVAVFKANADQVEAFSARAATDVGLSRGAYQQFATVVGAQLKNLGIEQDAVAGKTNDLIALGADLAAQFGGETSTAVEALSSLLRGERDPIERYGVSIKQVDIDARKSALGLDKLTGEADRQAEITATLSLLWEQTADAQGTFFRETDTYAHKQQVLNARLEDAKARLGESLLPAFTSVVSFADEKLLPKFDNIIDRVGPKLEEAFERSAPKVQELLDKIDPLVDKLVDMGIDAIPDVIDGLDDFVTAIPEWIDAFQQVDQAAYDFSDWFYNLQDDLKQARQDRIDWWADLTSTEAQVDEDKLADMLLATVPDAVKEKYGVLGEEAGNEFVSGTNAAIIYGSGATRDSAVQMAEEAAEAAKNAASRDGYQLGLIIPESANAGIIYGAGATRDSAIKLAEDAVNAAATKAHSRGFELGQGLSENADAGLRFGAGATRDSAIKLAEDAVKAGKVASESESVLMGRNIADGAALGVRQNKGNLTSAVSEMAGEALREAKRELGIKSPSTKFRDEVGRQTAAGWALGVLDGKPAVDDAYQLLATLPDGSAAPLGPRGRDESGRDTRHVQVNYEQTVVVGDQDPRLAGRQMARSWVQEISGAMT